MASITSNTSNGRGAKGSKFWMQTVINFDGGEELLKRIQKVDSIIGSINWISPSKSDNYAELKTQGIPIGTSWDLSFWPNQGPQWDAVGKDDKGTVILVEAKAHIAETKTSCHATSQKSKDLIKKSMREAHNILAPNHTYDEDVWYKQYYQMGNRIAHIVMLAKQGISVKLLLLNFVDDPTHIGTSKDQWKKHYLEVFNKMLGQYDPPDSIVIVNFDVG